MIIKVKIHPNSKENKVISYDNNVLELRIKAPAIENKANKELINFLSKILNIEKRLILIKIGANSKNKLINIEKIDLDIDKIFSQYKTKKEIKD